MIEYIWQNWDGTVDWYGRYRNPILGFSDPRTLDSLFVFASTFNGAAVVKPFIFFLDGPLPDWVIEKAKAGNSPVSFASISVSDTHIFMPYESTMDHSRRKDFLGSIFHLDRDWKILLIDGD